MANFLYSCVNMAQRTVQQAGAHRRISARFRSSFGDGVNFPIRTVDEDYDSLLGRRQRWIEEGDDANPGK